MSKHLQLTPEQAEQVKVINLKYAELQQSATRQNRKANKQARNAEMEKVLTPAQYQQLLQQELRKGKGSKDRAAVKRDTVKQTDQPAEE